MMTIFDAASMRFTRAATSTSFGTILGQCQMRHAWTTVSGGDGAMNNSRRLGRS